jgi:S1-C subfamily serine protease
MDNVPITRIEKLLSEVHKRETGERVNLTVYRGGLKYFVEVSSQKLVKVLSGNYKFGF